MPLKAVGTILFSFQLVIYPSPAPTRSSDSGQTHRVDAFALQNRLLCCFCLLRSRQGFSQPLKVACPWQSRTRAEAKTYFLGCWPISWGLERRMRSSIGRPSGALRRTSVQLSFANVRTMQCRCNATTQRHNSFSLPVWQVLGNTRAVRCKSSVRHSVTETDVSSSCRLLATCPCVMLVCARFLLNTTH